MSLATIAGVAGVGALAADPVATVSVGAPSGLASGRAAIRPAGNDAARFADVPRSDAGLPRATRDAAGALFADAEAFGETRALIILKAGRPVLERYGPGYGADSRLISWSMAKTITALGIGVLVGDGRLALDSPAPVPAWRRSGDPRGQITLRHLLTMSSGLEHVENGDPVWDSDTVRMLFGEGSDDMAAYAEAKPGVEPPGKAFVYSSATSVILADIMARTLTQSADPAVRRMAVLDFLSGRLTEPIGIGTLTPEFDRAGTMIGGSIMHATARDYARIGEFMRLRGTAPVGRLLSDTWFDFMLAPSAADAGYGGHVWLNRPRPDGAQAALWPGRGPADLFALIGHQGQYVIVSPRQRLVVVRLGISTAEQIARVRETLADLAAPL